MLRNFILGFAALSLVACGNAGPSAPTPKQVQAQKASEAANSLTFTENAEIDNIKARLTLTSNPGAIGYVVLLNESGQPVLYTSVKGKITSSGKRLTRTQTWEQMDCGTNGTCDGLIDGPSDEGTYGSSDPYIYFWDTNGTYHQWSGRYLYSDKPIRLSVSPLVVSVKAAS